MSRSRTKLRIALGGALSGGLGLVHAAAFGQDGGEEPVGLRLIVDYSAGIDVNTNEQLTDPSEGTYTALVNGFDFAILSNTRYERFAFTFGTELRLQDDPAAPDTPFDWYEPSFRLQYSREAANARFGAQGSLLVREVQTVEPFFIDLNGDTIIDQSGFSESQGTLTQAGARVTLETGIYSPIGTTYSASYQSRTYSDTDDPSLTDRLDYRFSTSTHLRFTDVSAGRVDLALRQYEYSGGSDLTGDSISVSVGLTQDVSPTLQFDGSIGYSKVHEDQVINDENVIDVNQGPNALLLVTKEVPDGTYFGSYRRDLVENDFRNTLSFGRTISMANYDLSGNIGLTNLDGGDPAPTFGLSFVRDLPDGQLLATFRQTVTLNTDDDERTLTAATVRYSHEINEVSSFNLGFDYSFVRGVGNDSSVDPETRTTLIAAYRHELTRDWGLSVGYRGRTRAGEDANAVSNAVFVNVGRRFIFRP